MKKIILIVVLIFSLGIVLSFVLVERPSGKIEVIDKTIKVLIKEGGTTTKTLSFFNPGDKKRIIIETGQEVDYIGIDNEYKETEKKEFEVFDINFIGKEKGVKVGRFLLSDFGNSEDVKEVPYSFIVESKNVLFKPVLVVSQNSLDVGSRGEVVSEITYHNLKATLDDALVRTELLDLDGNVLSESEGVISVGLGTSVIQSKTFQTDGLEEGTYLIVVSMSQGTSFSAVTEFINVNSMGLSPVTEKDYSGIIYIIVFAFLITSAVVLSYYWNRRVLSESKDWRKKIGELKKVKFSDAAKSIRKLKRQQSVLDRAFNANYISKPSYNEGTREIKALTSKLKKKL